jgi:hypothetical protein
VTFRWGGVVRYGEAGLSAPCGNAHDLSAGEREGVRTRQREWRELGMRSFMIFLWMTSS